MSLKTANLNIPELEVYPTVERDVSEKYSDLIRESGIFSYSPEVEVWTSSASNKALAYYTHGIFRYFGKFPPPVARHLIKTYTKERDVVIDPMCGSGTTLLESALLNRKSLCFDINPLSVLISKVKTTPIDSEEYLTALNNISKYYSNTKDNFYFELHGLRNPDHWFLSGTRRSLSKIKKGIDVFSTSDEVKDALTVAFLSIVRRVSRATTQQGRLFLDVETAQEDAFPFFEKKANELIGSFPDIPNKHLNEQVVERKSVIDQYSDLKTKSNLIICHPPYFNSYKYSGVNSLELSWLGVNHADVRKQEVREAFKVGKAEKVEQYLVDMEDALRNLGNHLNQNGVLALMIGDTVIKGQYIPVTKMLIERVSDQFVVEKSALRLPKFTEASWAASQRRKGNQVGVNLCDLMVILRKV